MSIALRCERCQGNTLVAGVRCAVCEGRGAVTWWGDVALSWSLAVDQRSVRGRRITRVMRGATVVLLLAITAAGFAAAFLAISREFVPARWFDLLAVHPDGRALPFWVGVLSVAIALVMLIRERDRSRSIPPEPMERDAELPLRAPEDWGSLAGTTLRSVAASLHADTRAALERAGTLADHLHHVAVRPIHCFAAILATPSGASFFGRLSVDVDGLKNRIQNALAVVPTFEQEVTIAPETFDALFRAYVSAARQRSASIRVLDLLRALAEPEGTVRTILDDLGIEYRHVVNVGAWIRIREDLRDRYRSYRARSALRPHGGMNRAMTAIATPILDAFASDLTMLAAAGYIGPTVGRDRIFRECFRILESGRRGFVLVGPPGVGRSAIIEGIAERMAADDVPEPLRDKRLVRLDVARLTSGVAPAVAQERLLAALEEVVRSKNVVLVVEQLEHLMGAGVAGAAGIDFGDILATEVRERGVLLMGSATPEAHRSFIERSAIGEVLERVSVRPPEGDEATQIVEARSILVEAHQQVFFTYGALEACVQLSDRYLPDRHLPEKAIALMEEVATMVRTERGTGSMVATDDVAAVIEEKTGIPARAVSQDEAERLLRLEQVLHERMVGQDEAVRLVAAALRRARTELRDPDRPIATFLFLGPTGVGKTELAKTLASTYFGSEDAMVRLDMSEYQDATSVHRLLGAPPGYAGADAGGQLTEAVRRNPFTIVLLDELEKAHPDILNVFLQVFEDGRLTDSAGRTVQFTNAIIIATSNAGTPFIQQAVAAGQDLEYVKRALMEEELRHVFRPEFLNRFDGVVVFTPLTPDAVRAIAELMLKDVAAQLEAKGIRLRVTEGALTELARDGYDPQFGARPLRRLMQTRVQDALATYLLENKIGRRDTAVFDAGGVIRVEEAEEIAG